MRPRLLIALALFGFALPAHAHGHRHHQHARHYLAQGNLRTAQNYMPWAQSSGLVTVSTAAGILITVAADVASKFQGFIGDLVAEGYRPRHIGCAAHSGHVRNSNHYWGGACDIDQRGWGRTAGPMYRVASLAAKWGLRDGCTFGDCGHVDVPRNIGLRSYAYRSRRRRRA